MKYHQENKDNFENCRHIMNIMGVLKEHSNNKLSMVASHDTAGQVFRTLCGHLGVNLYSNLRKNI